MMPSALESSAGGAIAWLYIVTNAARVFTYAPQLIVVWRSQDGARDISLLTWGSWVVANATAVAYGTLVVHDLFFTLIAMLNMVCCAAIACIALRRRSAHGVADRRRPGAPHASTSAACPARGPRAPSGSAR